MVGYASQNESTLMLNSVDLSEIVEWRVKTCQMSKNLNQEQQEHLMGAAFKNTAEALYLELMPSSELEIRSSQIKTALEELLQQAYRIAILFRRSNLEYRWLQKGGHCFRRLVPGDVQAVFGEVIKGSGTSGRIENGSHLLRQCVVLLGPTPRVGLPPPESYVEGPGIIVPPPERYVEEPGTGVPPLERYVKESGTGGPPSKSYVEESGIVVPPPERYVEESGIAVPPPKSYVEESGVDVL